MLPRIIIYNLNMPKSYKILGEEGRPTYDKTSWDVTIVVANC